MTTQTYRLEIKVDADNAVNTLNSLENVLKDLTDNTKDLSGVFDKLKVSLTNISQSSDGVAKAVKKASQGLEEYSKETKQSSNEAKKAADDNGKLSDSLKRFGEIAGGVFGGNLLTNGFSAISNHARGAFSAMMEAQREFDVLNAQLITATGSADKAAIAFEEIKKFAKETPYGLSQATEGFAKLKNLGLEPSIDSLKSYGNTAAAMGKDLSQMIEAVADATTGEFERLKEFGIKVNKIKGDTDHVVVNFQGASKKIGSSAKEIEAYLLGLGNVQFAGAMEARMDSLDGAIAGLDDSVSSFWLTLSQSGVGDVLKDVVNGISSHIESLESELSNPRVVQAFESAVSALGTAFELLKGAVTGIGDLLAPIGNFLSTNPEFAIALASGLTAAATAYFVITGAMSLFATVSGAVATAGGLAAMATTALGTAVAFLTSPITIAVAAIAALVAIGVYLYRNWDDIKAKAIEV